MRRGQHRGDLSPEELELERAKRNEWYRTRSPEYKEELLKKQRAYTARKRAEAAARGEKIRRTYRATQEQKELHNKQNALAKQKRIEEHQKEIEEKGLTDVRVCTVCTKIKPVKAFLGAKGYGKLCKVCNTCRARIYMPGSKGENKLGPSFWVRRANVQNNRLLGIMRKDNPEYTIFDVPERLLAEDLSTLYDKQQHLCYYCGAELDEHLQIDHKIPRSLGGSNTVDNICLSCPDCNRMKWNRASEEFISFLKLYSQRVVSKYMDKEP